MEQYKDFAFVYDELMNEVDYNGWVKYIEDIIKNENGQLIRQIRVTINPGRVYSFYGLGNKPNFQIFQSLDGATFMI